MKLGNNVKLLNTGTIETVEKHANIDYFYGPYDSDEDAISTLTLNGNDDREVGLTVGIYTDENHVKVKEKWFQIENDEYVLVDKTEEYKMILKQFNITITEDDRIKITYEIGGKGLLPKVSISGTNVLQTPVNFNSVEEVYVDVSIPKVYYFKISVSDVLGTFFDNNNIDLTQSIAWGDIIVKTTNTSYVTNVLPQKSSYENKPLGILVEYNVNKVSNVQILLYGDNTLKYTFQNISIINGKISLSILLPTGDYYGRNNRICATYTDIEDGINKSKDIYSFNILLPNEFDLVFPEGIPSVGYSGSSLPITVNLQYGGGNVKTKLIEISFNNENVNTFELGVNTTLLLYYILPELQEGTDSISGNLKIKLLDYTPSVERISGLEIRKIESPIVPIGLNYFNSSQGKNVTPAFNYYNNNISIPEPTNPLIWSGTETVLTISENSFNIDFNINYSLSGENLPLIKIEQNGKNLLTVGQQKISSDLFNVNGKTYQTNGLTLPQDNQDVHIGFGYQRAYTSGKYYSCIFINGEIAFCSETFEIISSGLTTIEFNNSFLLYELCLSTNNTPSDLINCVNSSGQSIDLSYKLIEGSQYDVFYYNWLTTLPLDYTILSNDDLLKLLLIPLTELLNDEQWQSLRSSLGDFGSNIKDTNSKTEFKEFKFVKFGKINHGNKNGIVSTLQLFEFLKDDKEARKLDKLCGVLCKYKFVKGAETSFNDNKYCIVQVQGTSTLAYPVPNFQFTFIKYVEGEGFLLDEEVQLNYQSPNFRRITEESEPEDLELIFESETVSDETNLVAKADSMDSSHLNNTPTCVYFNAIVEALAEDLNEFNGFLKFDLNYLDAIVGTPILLEIDSNENSTNYSFNDNISTVNLFDSYGTFMFNTGKSAKCMGLADDNNKMFSLEGLSNEESDISGAAGLFTLPTTDLNVITQIYTDSGGNVTKTAEELEYIQTENSNIVNAFNKLSLNYENNDVSVDDLQVTDEEKELIINYLINDTAFESRSTIDDDNITDINNWTDYALPILRMWLFVNRAEGTNPAVDNFAKYFDKVFNKEYAILYYIHLLLFGQADNLGKNMMLDCKYGENMWYIRPYDLDSEFGLTNNGFDDFPPYACISQSHFLERFIDNTYIKINLLPADTFNKYNSKSSKLWQKFWAAFKSDIESYYRNLRRHYLTPERIILLGEGLVNSIISKEQYNIDFSLKHLGTNFSYLNKGGRFLNYKDWVIKRFMYVDSYFSYFTADTNDNGLLGFKWTVDKTLIPIFYEANYQSPKTRYGYDDFVYETTLNSNLQYVFKIVPEAVLSMSPIWGTQVGYFNAGKYKNLQKYSGEYNSNLFSQENETKFNLREIEILLSSKLLVNSPIYVPKSVRVLKLQNIVNSSDNFLNIPQDSNLEELYIHDCDFGILTLNTLNKLKVLEITSSSSNNYTNIGGTLTLQNLSLSKLKIGVFTKINTLLINGSTTQNNYIDLSGIDCLTLTFNNATVEELHLDQLYYFNGDVCSVYDFNNNGDFRLAETSNLREELKSSNIQIKRNEQYEYIYSNASNFNRISPSISSNLVDTLDLSGCSNLKTLSCIGYTKLLKLTIPLSVKTLNLLYCKGLKQLNSNDSINFTGLTGLSSKPNYVIIGLTRYYGDDELNYSPYSYYVGTSFNVSSFNLLGCDSIQHIKNITNNTVSNFTGEYFVAGCRNLEDFENCALKFTDLRYGFRMNEKLQLFPDSFDILDVNNVTAAFGDCLELNITTILNQLRNKSLNASNLFSGVKINDRTFGNEGLGSASSPVELQWENCNSLFAVPNKTESSIVSNEDYEYMCITNLSYGKNAINTVDESSPLELYIKLPNTRNVERMFLRQNVVIKNVDTIFEDNQNLLNANCFVALTKQDKLIDLTGCNSLTYANFLYCKCKELDKNEIINGLKLPSGITHIIGLFRDTDLSGVDVARKFSGLTNLSDISSCFCNTHCDCSNSPFDLTLDSDLDNFTVKISAMFAETDSNVTKGTISDLGWVRSKMNTNAITYLSENSFVNREIGGVFEGKVILNFMTVGGENISNAISSQKRMFRNTMITSFDLSNINLEFEIRGTDSSQIFEGASFSMQLDVDSSIILKIANNVQNISKGFMNASIRTLAIDLLNTNTIVDLSYFACRAVGKIKLNDNKLDGYSFFSRLVNISHMFDQTKLSTEGNYSLSLTLDLPSYLFKNVTSLSNLNYFYKDFNGTIVFDFSGCSGIRTMEYAFARSGITEIPKFAQELNGLTSIKGAFRQISLQNSSLSGLSITCPNLINAEETFIGSTSDTEIGINISGCTRLGVINSFSGLNNNNNCNINLILNDTYSNIYALLPTGYIAGKLYITGAGPQVESTNKITYTYSNNTHWTDWGSDNISTDYTNRNTNSTTDVHTLANIQNLLL